MKNLIRFLSFVFAVAGLLSLLIFIWNYRQHYGDWGKTADISQILDKYEVGSLKSEQVKRIAPPKLPDITPYTVKAIKDKIPDVKAGSLVVENLETGYPVMRKQLAVFGEKQDRLDPLSIVIIDGVYDLDAVIKDVNDPSLIEKREDGTYVLYVPLFVRSEATLLIKEKETLLISADVGGLLSSFGKIFIYKATIKGWNINDDEPAKFKHMDDFRPYIASWCGSKLYIAGSDLSHLGYQFSKSYGVTYTACTDTLYRADYAHLPGATGWLIDNVFYDIYYGFYSYEADDVVILGNLYEDNTVYAIDPHDRSKNLIIAHNTTRGSKQKHGIIVSREVADSYIFRNLTENNNGSGIMIDRSSHNNIIAYNLSQYNGGDGLTIYESPDNISYQNTLIHNKSTGIRVRNSWDFVSQEDVISYNEKAGVQVYSLYLTPERGATYRDLELDPYVQKAGATIIDAEMVGNYKSNFMIENANTFKVLNPRMHKSPNNLFSGDLKHIDAYVENDLYDSSKGVSVVKKSQDQNLTRSSVEPR